MLVFVLLPISIYAANTIDLRLSVNGVVHGGEITLSGHNESNEDVVVKIVRPNQTVFYVDVLSTDSGSFSTKVSIPTDEIIAPYGVYTVVVGHGSVQERRTFSVVRSASGESSTGSNDSITAPQDQTGIPVNDGQAIGSTIEPKPEQAGHYQIGRETFNQAIQMSSGAVTIKLPKPDDDSDTILEFPLVALHDLQD